MTCKTCVAISDCPATSHTTVVFKIIYCVHVVSTTTRAPDKIVTARWGPNSPVSPQQGSYTTQSKLSYCFTQSCGARHRPQTQTRLVSASDIRQVVKIHFGYLLSLERVRKRHADRCFCLQRAALLPQASQGRDQRPLAFAREHRANCRCR